MSTKKKTKKAITTPVAAPAPEVQKVSKPWAFAHLKFFKKKVVNVLLFLFAAGTASAQLPDSTFIDSITVVGTPLNLVRDGDAQPDTAVFQIEVTNLRADTVAIANLQLQINFNWGIVGTSDSGSYRSSFFRSNALPDAANGFTSSLPAVQKSPTVGIQFANKYLGIFIPGVRSGTAKRIAPGATVNVGTYWLVTNNTDFHPSTWFPNFSFRVADLYSTRSLFFVYQYPKVYTRQLRAYDFYFNGCQTINEPD